MGKRRDRKNRDQVADSDRKREIVEKLTTWLYDVPSRGALHDQGLPSRDGLRERQIDVLLTVKWSPDTVERWVIECKNYGRKIEVGDVDAFVGKLDDIGVPQDHGIFVAVEGHGYTRDAKQRAAQNGIELQTLSGLDKDRLRAEVLKALQSNIYLLADIVSISLVGGPATTAVDLGTFYDGEGQYRGTVADLIWWDWQAGRLEPKLGQTSWVLDVPADWYVVAEGQRQPVGLIGAVINVVGYALTVEGTANLHTLFDEQRGLVERFGARAWFEMPAGTYVLAPIFDEESLDDFITRAGHIHISQQVRLPRIRFSNFAYWPLSERVAEIVKSRMDAYNAGLIPDPRPFSFLELEGTDLSRVWEAMTPGYVEWPWEARERPGNAEPESVGL